MIKNLQILRAIAALLVVFFHCNFLGLKVGQFGVDIFFVISGFIISFVLSKNQSHFLIKRFIRVVPMYYAFTLVIIFAWAIYPAGFKNVTVTTESVIKSLLFIPYYIGDSGPILSLGWTLNYEIYFYVTVGLFAIFLKKSGMSQFLAVVSILTIFLTLIVTDSTNYQLRFYGHQITLEFIFGIILYQVTKKWRIIFQSKWIIFLSGLAALVSFILMLYFDHHKIYANRTLVFGIPAFFIVFFFIISDNITNPNNFLHRLFYGIGNASYVIYLCHPFIIFFIIRLVNPLLPVGLFYSIIELVMMMSFVTVASVFVHKKVELPIVKFLERCLHHK